MIVAKDNYAEILEQAGIQARSNSPWLSVGDVRRVQGWKFHISSTPVESCDLLRAILPFLADNLLPFKVAESGACLVRLNDGSYGGSQIGKFMTIYPHDDSNLEDIAAKLIERTVDFTGPVVASDYWLGGVIYVRYGAFNPILRRNRLGEVEKKIFDHLGTERRDSYEAPITKRKRDINHLIGGLEVNSDVTEEDRQGGIFGPGYLLTDVLQMSAKGSVFRAIDVRNPKKIKGVVLKEGRYKCCSDMFGRDIADRLSHQKIIHERLCSSVRVPLALDLFQNRHNTYLAIEYISGRDFSTEIPFDWRGRSRADRVRLLRAFENISAAIARFHAEGYVHRDLKPSNIRVGKQGQIWLIDLELAYQLVDGGTPFQQGTPGYMSPQQQRGEAPISGDDVYSLGATFFHVLSGLHPNSFAFDVEHGALLRASDLLYFLPADLIELIVACCSPAPEKRPSAKVVRKRLQVVRRALCEARDQPSGHPFPLSCPSQSTLKEALAACCHGLASDVMLDSRSGVWMSHSLERPGSYEHLISANRGAAGALYVAARLSRQDLSNALLSARARTTAEWLLSCPDTSDSGLPGLHFGRAGCAVAIAEAVRGGIIEGGTTVQTYIRESLGGVLDWPDLTHGAAGQGIAAMYCADCLGNEDWAVLAAPCARYLVDSQRSDGSWEMPTGVDVLTGEVFSGFAHGVAGIVYFLSAYSHRFGDKSVETSWTRGADWLILNSVSSRANSQLAWTWSLQNKSVWNWWCHGAPGIALTFLSLYGASGNERFATVARQALQSVPEGIRSGSLGQCHGLAGIGEIFLEAARTLAEPFWKDRSLDIANTIMQLARSTPEGTCTWKVDDAPFPTADLMVGNGGIAHFLMRAIKYEESIGFPLLLGASPR